MEVIRLTNKDEIPTHGYPPLSLAIGYFDGVHIGHQEVIGKAKKIANENGFKSGCLTFDPSPKAVLGKDPDEVKYITMLNEKIKLIENLDIDYLFIVPFTKELASLSPEQFIQDYIIQLNVKHLIAGFDYTYGKYGKGNMSTIEEHGQGHFKVTTIPKVTKGGEKISSTYIRELIAEGKVAEVPEILGRRFTMIGIVIHGQKRGRELGYPTANIETPLQYIYPKNGIYIVRVLLHGERINGVASIGYNPTFNKDQKKRFLEVHLIDFDKQIYGENVFVEWHQYLRGEIKFSNVEDLIEQISQDKQNAIDYFSNSKNTF